jgi:SPP1 gp7 family putative phage head morphogenesis protein
MKDEEIKQVPNTDEIAVATKDIDMFSGWIDRLENPDPILKSEAKGKGLKLYDEVNRDGHAGAVLQQRYLAVTSKPWDVIPGEDNDRAREIAAFVKETLEGTNLKQANQEILEAILYGYRPVEIMWAVKKSRVVVSKLRAKHPRRFQFTLERALRMITPDNMLEGEQLPDRKFIVFTYGSSDNPYGSGLGQKMWWPVWFKKHGIKFWMIFLDKFGSPTPVGKYPAGTKKNKQDELLAAIEALQQETGVIVPADMMIDLLEASRTGNVTYETLCEYMDRQNTKAVLSQTGTTDIKDAGSYNASQTLDEVRQAICESDADLLCECLNDSLIKWLVDYNFANVERYPQFKIYAKPSKNTKDQAETDKILINDIGLPVGEKYLYEKYNIPEPVEGEKLVNPPKPAPEPARPFEQFSDAGFDFAESSMDEVDRLIDRQVDPAAEALDRNIDLVKEYLARATDLDTAKKGLPKLLAEMNVSRLADALSTGMQTAWDIGVKSVGADQDFAEVLWGPGTPFKSAMDYFKSRAFYISNVTNADILAAVQAEIEKAMEGNLTLEEFKKEVDSIFTRNGYDRLSPYQIKAVFQTNLHINYQGGRYYQMKSPAVVKYRPYWRYVAVKDGSTRPEHWANHGKIFPQDHPFWDTWYPPNGYNCRCTVVSLSQREMDRNGWKVETQDPTGLLYEPVDPFTGIKSPARLLMPDTGWAKNPAKEVWEADFKKYSPDLAAALKKQVESL